MTLKVMGLDISTSCIGISILRKSNRGVNIYLSDYFKPNKKLDLIDKMKDAKEYILNIIKKEKPDVVVIEDIIKFMPQKSSATTIINLAAMNKNITLAVYEFTGIKPVMLNVQKIRHTIKTGKKQPKKEEVPELISKLLSVEFPYVISPKGKIMYKESEDVADSIAVALAYLKMSDDKV